MSGRGIRQVRVEAAAKINLFLHVLEAREDGYHDLVTLFQAIDFCDRLRLERRDRGVDLTVRGADVGPTRKNLVYRAAEAFFDRIPGGARIELEKSVPAGAGLGGGSSDAAAALRGLNELFGRPLEPGALRDLARPLGADVPFFLCGSPLALGRGRGDRLESLEPLPVRPVVIGVPAPAVSTAAAYAALEAARQDVGATAPTSVSARSWKDLAGAYTNDFQPVVEALHPEIGAVRRTLEEAGARVSLVSGSGSAVFGLFDDEASADRAREEGLASGTGRYLVSRTLKTVPPVRAG